MNKKLIYSVAIGFLALSLLYYQRINKNKLAENKKNDLKNKIKSEINSGKLVRVNSDNALDTNKPSLDKLSRTIDADLLSIDELQKISDGIDAYLGRYVGVKSEIDVSNESEDIFRKYQIIKN